MSQFLKFLDQYAKTSGNRSLCEAVKTGYKACFESIGFSDCHIYLESNPNYHVAIATDSMDPHPMNFYVSAYDEADALETVVKELVDHGFDGMLISGEPEYSNDYIEAGNYWIRDELVSVTPYDGENVVVDDVPEEYLSYLVNGDQTGMTDDEIAAAEQYEKDFIEEGLQFTGPVDGPNGEFWDREDNFRTGPTVKCTFLKK